MKRMLGWVVLSSVLAVAVPAVQAKWLENDSFEDAEEEADNPFGDLAAHWGRWGSWMNRESIWKPVKDGKCVMGYHHWQIESADGSGIYQDIEDVPAGAEVTFSIHVARDTGTNAECVEVRLEGMGGAGTIASQIVPIGDLKSGWTKISVSGLTQGGGVRVLVSVTPKAEGQRKGAVKFDAASLKIDKTPDDAGSVAGGQALADPQS